MTDDERFSMIISVMGANPIASTRNKRNPDSMYKEQSAKPPYPFSHGLAYPNFACSERKVDGGETIATTCTATNTGKRAGADMPQAYLADAAGGKRTHLLVRFDVKAERRHIAGGIHRVALGKKA